MVFRVLKSGFWTLTVLKLNILIWILNDVTDGFQILQCSQIQGASQKKPILCSNDRVIMNFQLFLKQQ